MGLIFIFGCINIKYHINFNKQLNLTNTKKAVVLDNNFLHFYLYKTNVKKITIIIIVKDFIFMIQQYNNDILICY